MMNKLFRWMLCAACLLLSLPIAAEAAAAGAALPAAPAISAGAKVMVADFDYANKEGDDAAVRQQFSRISMELVEGLLCQDGTLEIYETNPERTEQMKQDGMGLRASAMQQARDMKADYLILGNLSELSNDDGSSYIFLHATVKTVFTAGLQMQVVDVHTGSLVKLVTAKGKAHMTDTYNSALSSLALYAQMQTGGAAGDPSSMILEWHDKGEGRTMTVATYNAAADAVSQLLGHEVKI